MYPRFPFNIDTNNSCVIDRGVSRNLHVYFYIKTKCCRSSWEHFTYISWHDSSLESCLSSLHLHVIIYLSVCWVLFSLLSKKFVFVLQILRNSMTLTFDLDNLIALHTELFYPISCFIIANWLDGILKHCIGKQDHCRA